MDCPSEKKANYVASCSYRLMELTKPNSFLVESGNVGRRCMLAECRIFQRNPWSGHVLLAVGLDGRWLLAGSIFQNSPLVWTCVVSHSSFIFRLRVCDFARPTDRRPSTRSCRSCSGASLASRTPCLHRTTRDQQTGQQTMQQVRVAPQGSGRASDKVVMAPAEGPTF